MVPQGIVLGHIIFSQGIEVDKAKVELIVKLPSPTTVKGVRQFLGHAGFYRRFIKDFSKLARPLCELLVKDTKFVWDDRCQRSFEELKLLLTTAPIVRAPNWQLPFEVMCDVSDFAIGVVLGQREDGKPYVIYYAIKMLNEAQRNYIITEKELCKSEADKMDSLALRIQSSDQRQEESGECVTGEVPNQIIWKCVPEQEQQGILSHCHESACGGHFASQKTAMKVLQSGFCWPSLFKDASPLDYVSKWVEAIPCKQNDHRVVLKFLKENIFFRFGVPKAIISDGGTHFCNKPFEILLAKYEVKHKAYRTTYKTILGMSPYHIVYGKACHLPVEVQYKAWWAIKMLNMDLNRAGVKRFLDLNEMEELRIDAYINSNIAKQRLKMWHDQLVSHKQFQKGQRVLLYDSKLHIFPGKLKSRWIFNIHEVYSNGVVELLSSTRTFKVNGQCLKPFLEPFSKDNEEINLLEPHQA
ncbi:Retrovirus-related Pol polyprotein from transposon opus [Vitis vinifera]|uniref:Retrovirus-related Pol polyprotein from transposon opus n=1 Tax=Vitis vinifera TaxID=29760 RepID=A0A438C791_VITVI|nr:Retrovirus-related Pol polyprotein from transposon opus [Vitis vinifera]